MMVLSENVINLLNKKSEAAFDVVFTLYYPRLVAFAKEFVPEEDAQNLVQDAFYLLFTKSPSFQNEHQLQSYLYSVAKNNCLMFLRHQKVKQKYSELQLSKANSLYLNIEALERLDTSPIAFTEIERIINETIENLPPRCREVFVLSRMEGKKNAEVANMLNISEKAVEAQISRALKTFRVSLQDYLALLVFLF